MQLTAWFRRADAATSPSQAASSSRGLNRVNGRDRLEIRSHYLNGPAFGGLVGTARGFGKFLQDQLHQHSVLFNDATRLLFYAPQQTTRGTPVPTTLGWHIGDLDGRNFFYKEGGGGGFHCMMRVYPTDGIGTVVMTNATGFDVRDLLDTIDGSFLTQRTR